MEAGVVHIGAKGAQRHPFAVQHVVDVFSDIGSQNNGGAATVYAHNALKLSPVDVGLGRCVDRRFGAWEGESCPCIIGFASCLSFGRTPASVLRAGHGETVIRAPVIRF